VVLVPRSLMDRHPGTTTSPGCCALPPIRTGWPPKWHTPAHPLWAYLLLPYAMHNGPAAPEAYASTMIIPQELTLHPLSSGRRDMVRLANHRLAVMISTATYQSPRTFQRQRQRNWAWITGPFPQISSYEEEGYVTVRRMPKHVGCMSRTERTQFRKMLRAGRNS